MLLQLLFSGGLPGSYFLWGEFKLTRPQIKSHAFPSHPRANYKLHRATLLPLPREPNKHPVKQPQPQPGSFISMGKERERQRVEREKEREAGLHFN